jgi:alkylation response protein AidB-like acyl-CoA dehydrogenase
MTLALTAEDRAFQDELARWLDLNLDAAGDRAAWHRRLVEGRWAVPSWPERFGGRACTVAQEILHAREMAVRDAPLPRNEIALFNIGPTLLALGTEAQKERYLPPMLAAEEIWCQGFSEPNAGSDLAALETRAVDEGDHWRVTGQKVWTTFADHADKCLALVRTDPTARHRGISALIVDMHAPGVEVRPIREITGETGFNHIFFDGVRVLKSDVVGDVNGGWKVAMQTLLFERIGTMKLGVQLEKRLAGVVDLAKRLGKDGDPLVEDELAARAIEVDLMRLLTERALEAVARGDDPGACLPLGKLQWSYLMQDLAELAMKIGGPSALAWRGGCEPWPHHCVYSRMTTIGAGTTEVQKNILAYRALGLPREADTPPAPAPSRDARLDDEMREMREQVRRFLREACPIGYVRRMLDDPRGTSDDVWRRLAELGLFAVLVPKRSGGLGLGYGDMGIVLEEMGRAVHPGPYFSTAFAAVCALRAFGDEDELLPKIARGACTCAVAHLDAPVEAVRAAGAFRLSGTALVPDGAAADVLLVPASTADGAALFAVDPRDAAVAALAAVDATRKIARATLRDAPARLVGVGSLEDAALRIAVGLAADAAGAADRALEIATEYAKVRRQFDRPIGAFQAIQHELADMLRDLELSRAGVHEALHVADGADRVAFVRAASAAKAHASDALYRVTAGAIQVLGGIGFTWEHDAHLFYKRALSMRQSYGGASEHRRRYAAILLRGR